MSRPTRDKAHGRPCLETVLLLVILGAIATAPALAAEGESAATVKKTARSYTKDLALPPPPATRAAPKTEKKAPTTKVRTPETHPISDIFIDGSKPEAYTPPGWLPVLPAGQQNDKTTSKPPDTVRPGPKVTPPPRPVPFAKMPSFSSTTLPTRPTSPTLPIVPRMTTATLPTRLMPPPDVVRPEGPATEEKPLDLNAASLSDLILLSGIDRYRARLILAHRRALGGFRSVDQLREVFGISESIFLKLIPLIKVGPYLPSRYAPPRGIRLPATPKPPRRPAAPSVKRPASRRESTALPPLPRRADLMI